MDMALAEVSKLAAEASGSAKSAHHRIDSLETEIKDIRQLAAAMSAVNQKVDDLTVDVRDIKDDVKSIGEKPARYWELLVGAIIGAVIYGAFNLAFSHFS